MIDLPLMSNNIIKEDIDVLIDFLKTSDVFTQSQKVIEFEQEWSRWLGVKHSVFVNSGSSANFITMAIIKELYGAGEIIVPPIGWESDIASVIAAGHKPVFVDINLKNLAITEENIMDAVTPQTKAVLLVHVLGLNGLSQKLLDYLQEKNISLIEDVCESHGASFNGKKLGSIGLISNFSFYYAHHMSTIEGGMICTNDDNIYQYARMFRSHGMARECNDEQMRKNFQTQYNQVHPEFTFVVPGYNMRSTELNAVIGLNQLKRLDENNKKRYNNFKLFLDHLDQNRYLTDYDLEGSVNYALILILREKDPVLFNKIANKLTEEKVEFRRGTAGGGNLARQPFVRKMFPHIYPDQLANAEHVHEYGMYFGNYPTLEKEKIVQLCKLLNSI